ncbi:MAG: hypothetical protein ABSB76_19470 [Streptosporangiaceae bacterium]
MTGGLVLFAFFLRISLGERVDSDGANSALQAWDLVHGHLMLHGWIFGDATFYAFELPLNGIIELLFGMGNLAVHVSSALTYLIVAACAVALATTSSRGPSRAARGAVVVAVLAAPLLAIPTVWVLLEEPDHIGTSMFLLVSFLLIDRGPDRRFTAPLVGLILGAGQLSDATVRYVAVPAVIVVCGYRVLAERKLRSGDTALVVAAAVSVPLETALRAAMAHFGAYVMVPPKAQLASPRLWPQHASVTWLDVRILFGAASEPGHKVAVTGAALGLICLLVVMFGLIRAVWTWRRASRAEQLLVVAIVFNLGTYTASVMTLPNVSRELAAVLPCGAVLAARALVPARITARPRAFAAVVVAGLIALLPLVSAATRPSIRPAVAPLAAFLAAHRLTYGIAGYWDASVVTLQSGNRVQVRTVDVWGKIEAAGWESNALWYNPAKYDATFAVANDHGEYSAARFEHFLGPPAAAYRVAGLWVLVYRTNLLRHIAPEPPGSS